VPAVFRAVEVITMAAAAVFGAAVIWDGRSRRWEGSLLVGVYGAMVVVYYFA
jgi:Ca2+/H+ antiporter